MPPPQLTGDAPVLDVFQPVVVGAVPVFGNQFDFAVVDCRQSRLNDGGFAFLRQVHEPLVGQHGFDHHAGAVGFRLH